MYNGHSIILHPLRTVVLFACMTTIGSAATHSTAPATKTALEDSKPICAVQYQNAAVTEAPVYDEPVIARDENISGNSIVKVSLDSNGGLTDASLWSSSGNPWLDQTALQVARSSKYSPESYNCQRVPGSYLIDVAF
jgi:TonB family protein